MELTECTATTTCNTNLLYSDFSKYHITIIRKISPVIPILRVTILGIINIKLELSLATIHVFHNYSNLSKPAIDSLKRVYIMFSVHNLIV